jgi:WD40 repeat protein
MNAEEALGIIEKVLNKDCLSKLQALVFQQSWEELSYQEIARNIGYEVGYVKQTGSQLWQQLSQALGEKVSKSNVQVVLSRYVNRVPEAHEIAFQAPMPIADDLTIPNGNLRSSSFSPVFMDEAPPSLHVATALAPAYRLHPTGQLDWGEAPDASVFYGRQQELERLEGWIQHDRCRLVGVFGVGGIGKTTLSVLLTQHLVGNFEFIIWRSLRNAPPLQDLLADLLAIIAPPQGEIAHPRLPDSLDGRMRQLLENLRAHRCLLILDNGETILQQGDRSGTYLPGYEGYGQLLQMMGESWHQSCLVLTSREKPNGFAIIEGSALPVRSLQLGGLPILDGQAILSIKGEFSGSDQAWRSLIEHYGGNPLALKIVASAIHDFFAGDLHRFLDFLQAGSAIFGDIRDLLAQQINRLSDLEQQILDWLAISREPLTLTELQANFVPAIVPGNLLEALTALERRGILERTRSIEQSLSLFTLQPVVMEYMTERLIERVCQEIEFQVSRVMGQAGTEAVDRQAAMVLAKLQTLNSKFQTPQPTLFSHALIQAQAKDYIRETQVRLILAPIAQHLLRLLPWEQLGESLKQILFGLRGKPAYETGYTAGNLLNLLCHLQVDLSGQDLSEQTLWQAYLRKVNLHGVNFAQSDLAKSIFTETFGQVLCVAFSPDGKWLATSDVNHEIHIWQVADGKKCSTCRVSEGWVWAIAFSPDGQTLASSANRAIYLWDVQTGQCLSTLGNYTGRIFSLSFRPNGQWLASGGEDGLVNLWDVETGDWLTALVGHTDEVRSVAFSPDGGWLASGSYDKNVCVWAVADWQPRSEPLTSHNAKIQRVGSQEATLLISPAKQELEALQGVRSQNHPSKIANPKFKIQHPRILSGHTDWVWSVAWSPDGKTLVSGGSDRCLKLWDLQTGQCQKTLRGHAQPIRTVAYSADGQTIVSGSDDQTVRLWQTATGDCFRVLSGHTSWVTSIAIAPDGSCFASGSEDQSVRLWDSATHACVRILQGYSNGVWSIAFHPNGQTLVSGGQDRLVRLWDLNRDTMAPPTSLAAHSRWIWSVAFSPDGQLLASGSEDHTIQLWNARTHQPICTLVGHHNAVFSVNFCPNSKILVSGSLDGTVKLWDVQTGQCLRTLLGHRGGIWSVALSADGKLIATGSQDQSIKIWEILTGDCLQTLVGHRGWIRCVTFSPDRQTLVSGSADGVLKSWQVSTGKCSQTIQAHPSPVLSVTYSPDGKILASGGADAKIKLWQVATGQCDQTLHGHDKWVRCLTFNASGTTLASCGQDETICLWRVGRPGKAETVCQTTLRVPRPYEGMNISGTTGLTMAQRASLHQLGAIEQRAGCSGQVEDAQTTMGIYP